MRDLIFRAKRLDNGEWVQGRSILTLITDDSEEMKFYMPQAGELFSAEAGETTGDIWSINGTFYKVDPETVGQYTGLTDKNGIKIFEGDVLKVAINETAKDEKGHQYYTGNKKFVYWSVEWVNFMNYLGWRVYGTDRRFNTNLSYSLLLNCPAEVIGNIHDNPELLEGGVVNG